MWPEITQILIGSAIAVAFMLIVSERQTSR